MLIEQTDNGKKGAFYVEDQGLRLAEMSYVWSGDTLMIIDHTEVDDRLAGRGVGKQLVQKAVELAREKQFKILPLCPFAKSVFDKTHAFHDVLKVNNGS